MIPDSMILGQPNRMGPPQVDEAPLADVERLVAMRRLDAAAALPEATLNGFVELARALFNRPLAAVALLDSERQCFQASARLAPVEAERVRALCDRAVEAGRTLVVRDSGLHAVSPLRSPDGDVFGAVALISPEPRAVFRPEERARLASLARLLEGELSLHRRVREAEHRLAEKDVMMRESHHRMNNSLQLVNAVLQSQAGRAADPGLRAALMAAADRVVTIGTVHRHLYRSRSAGQADAGAYLGQLVGQLSRGVADDAQGKSVMLDVPIALMLPASVLPRLGLVATELVTNALKHGSGRVDVCLRRDGRSVLLTVSDEGPGFPPGFDPAGEHGSLGFRLIGLLAEVGGVSMDRSGKSAVRVRLRVPETGSDAGKKAFPQR